MYMPPLKKKASNWPYLPDDLLNNVLDRLVAVSDYVRFAVVCNPWLTAARHHHKEWLESSPRQCPMLLVPIKRSMNHSLYTLENNTLVLTNSKLYVPYYSHMSCLGYSNGWLIFNRHHDTFSPMLFNPLTSVTICLPPITDEITPELYDKIKIFLSHDPSRYPDMYQVLALYNFDTIWLFRSGSGSWIRVQTPHPFDSTQIITDAIYHQGNFYITRERQFFRVEYDNGSYSTQHAILQQLQCDIGEILATELRDHDNHDSEKRFAVSCNGFLLYIEKCGDCGVVVNRFRVYWLYLKHGGPVISFLYASFYNETLLLGFGHPLSVLAPEFSDRRNERVYLMDRGNAMCFLEIIPGGYVAASVNPEIPPPIWIVPKINLNITFVAQGDHDYNREDSDYYGREYDRERGLGRDRVRVDRDSDRDLSDHSWWV